MFLIDLAWYLGLTGDKQFFLSMRDKALHTLEWMDRDGDRDGSAMAAYMRRALGLGSVGYVAIAVLIALLIGFVVYAAFAAFVHELIVGMSAMHAGWFPAFAVALITLIIGILLGFPPIALGLLVGFSASHCSWPQPWARCDARGRRTPGAANMITSARRTAPGGTGSTGSRTKGCQSHACILHP